MAQRQYVSSAVSVLKGDGIIVQLVVDAAGWLESHVALIGAEIRCASSFNGPTLAA